MRVQAVAASVRILSPNYIVDERISSLKDLKNVLPPDACVRIGFGDYFYAPFVAVALRDLPLYIDLQLGYVYPQFTQKDWTHLLTKDPIRSCTPAWSNNVYFLYHRTNVR